MNMIIYIFFFLVILTLILLSLTILISKKSIAWREKFIPFECGFDYFSYSRMPFSIRFFLIAIIFIIFDVEIAIILPLIPSILKSNIFKWTLSYFLILFILILGIFLEWKENSFEWEDFS